MRETIKRITPTPLLNLVRDTRDAGQRWAQWPKATFHPWRRESRERLAALKDIHKGKRCFVIGNGPSLNKTDLFRLENEFTFGMNRIYMMFPELGFSTTYLTCVNSLVIEQCAEDFKGLDIPTFLSWRSRNLLDLNSDGPLPKNISFLHTTYTGPKFAQDATGRLWEGATVTYMSLQLAYHMGFTQAILIGVDHSFVTKGKPNTTIVSTGDDPNHFHAGYFGKGFKWQLPDLDTSEVGYLMAREAFKADGREVLDATIGGKLTIFPKADYDSFF